MSQERGGGAYSFKQTFDGGLILDCNYGGVAGLIKTNSQGDTLWTKSYGISGFSYEVQQTADSGYIMVGIGDDPVSSYEYLIKTDVDGNTVWKKAYKGSSFNNDHSGFSVQQTQDGGYITAGGINRPVTDVYLIKTNSFGDTLWTKAYASDSINVGLSIFLTSDSGYIIAGYTSRIVAGTADVYLIKTDSIGNVLWSKSFGSSNYEQNNSIRQTIDGGYILAGKTNSFGAGDYDAYLIKTDANGDNGCYENNRSTILKAPATIVSLPADTIPSAPTLVNSFSALVSRGGIINTLCTTAEINELVEVNEISIYPNPAQYNFTISINVVVSNANLEIHNMFGEEIYSATLNHKQLTINCTSFPSGIYFISVRMDDQVITKKLIINK